MSKHRTGVVLLLSRSDSLIISIICILNAHTFIYFLRVYPQLPLSKGKLYIPVPKLFQRIVDILGMDQLNPFEVDE